MSASRVAQTLGGYRVLGGGFLVRCPVRGHGRGRGDLNPSLSVADGERTLLVNCFSGCDPRDVIEALRASGLFEANGFHQVTPLVPRESPTSLAVGRDTKRIEAAVAIWDAALPAGGTPVEEYLVSRGLRLPPPSRVRFHVGLKHPSGDTWPVMVGLVTHGLDDTPRAIHRTFLVRDGTRKAPVESSKMMLGPCRGGVVRLAPSADVVMIGEGIETCLAAMQAIGHPAWAALSTSGLRSLDLPDNIRDVIVLADGDDPGEAAAQDSALRWKREGRNVRIARAPRGMDFNDLLRSES